MTSIKRLLLATDFSGWARRAEHYACSLAASWQIPLSIMTVLEFPAGMDPEYALNKHYLSVRMDEASFQLADFKSRAILRGIEATTRVTTGVPSDKIIAAARAEDTDLLIVGTRGASGLAHVLLGSTAERVIRTAPCPVLAVRTPDGDASVEQGISLHRILAPTDFSGCSLEAMEIAAVVAMQSKASMDLLHVLEPVSYGIDFTLGDRQEREQRRRRVTEGLNHVAADLSKAGITVNTRIRGGLPATTILEEAQASSSDLIVMGTHGRRGLSHLVGGSVTEAVLRLGQYAVLAVRTPKFSVGHRRIISTMESTRNV
jgi:nucleotide-binding universal stress UspA family protein